MVLRIEDLDTARSKREYADAIRHDFERLGITWDNADVMYQGQREEAYLAVLDRLQERRLVYPCFCSRADLHSASAPHVGERYLYRGTCRGLTNAEREARAAVRPAATRLMVPDETLRFEDGIQGPQEQNLRADCGDFIIRRSDGVFAYQLAVVVDDLEQGVTQVVRGVDLMDSCPQQLYVKGLLDPLHPDFEYFHVPLLTDSAGKRLSKRERAQSLSGLLESFSSPEAFIGHLAGLSGIAPSAEAMSMDELLTVFSIDSLKGRHSIAWRLPGE